MVDENLIHLHSELVTRLGLSASCAQSYTTLIGIYTLRLRVPFSTNTLPGRGSKTPKLFHRQLQIVTYEQKRQY